MTRVRGAFTHEDSGKDGLLGEIDETFRWFSPTRGGIFAEFAAPAHVGLWHLSDPVMLMH
jgi:hypothetical protein